MVSGGINAKDEGLGTNAGHHLAAERLGGTQKLAGGGSDEWPCWIVQSVQDRNKTGYLAGNSFAE